MLYTGDFPQMTHMATVLRHLGICFTILFLRVHVRCPHYFVGGCVGYFAQKKGGPEQGAFETEQVGNSTPPSNAHSGVKCGTPGWWGFYTGWGGGTNSGNLPGAIKINVPKKMQILRGRGHG